MRPEIFGDVLAFDRALALVLESAMPVDRTETIALADADGRVVARDVDAPRDVPGFDRAAMDGYAVVADDTAGARPEAPVLLRLVGDLFTGQVPARGIGQGECIAIATGAPIPPGATAVVMVEETTAEGTTVRVRATVRPGQNIGRRGADVPAGRTVVSAGDVLTPGRIGAIAAVGAAVVVVFAKPILSVVSTGNEVIRPGQPLGEADVYDINRYTLGAVVGRHGGLVRPLEPAGDAVEALDAVFDRTTDSDVVVFSGGSSVGGRDLVVDAVRARGDVIFHGIAVKPGKPTLFGRVGRSLVFGMPGYPTSCLSNAYMLLVPLVRRLARLPPWTPQTVTLPLARRVTSTPHRHQFYTVRVVDGRAEPAFKASGDITSMANADGFIEIPIGVDAVEAETPVRVTLFT